MTELFHAEPAGLPGNDDLGATSSWYVWAALGLYPYVPGLAELRLHGPLFPRTVLHLAGGRTVEIIGRDAGAANPYVQSMRLGAVAHTRAWATLAELLAAGTLDFQMGPREEPGWGSP